METSEATRLTSWIERKFFWLYYNIAWWTKVLVESVLSGKEKEVMWPSMVLWINNVRPFQKINIKPWYKLEVFWPWDNHNEIDKPWINYIHPDSMIINYTKIVLNERDIWWLYNEKWEYVEVNWPWEYNVHPEWKIILFKKIRISEREAIVVIQKDWTEKIIKWSDESEYILNPVEEQLKKFSWTWSWETWPTSEKVPGSIVFDKIRLDDSQTYFSFPVRTKDNVVINLHLMLFYSISNLNNLVKNTHDPLCEFYNKIQSEVSESISKKSFNEFKDSTNEHISNIDFLKNDSFENIWLKIIKVALREWKPEDRDVQKVLERSAMVQSQKTLDAAEHERKMININYEVEEQTNEKTLSDWKLEKAKIEWELEAIKSKQVFKSFQDLSPEHADNLMKLYLASKAETLNIWSDMLK